MPFSLRLLAALLALAGVTAPAAAADDTPWAVSTDANDFGSGRANFGYTVNPGGQVTDGMVVTNHGNTPLDLDVYSADAFTAPNGGVDLLTRATASTGVGAWVRPGTGHLTIQPGEERKVPFIVTVPESATPGDHLGGIVTSLRQDGTERRLGIRIRLRVGGVLTPGLSAENLHLAYSGSLAGSGNATVSYTIRNTGNAIVAARQAVSVAGPFGTQPVPAAGLPDSPQLLPGESWPVSVPVQGVNPLLWLTSTVTLTPLLTDAAGSTAPLPAVGHTAGAWAVPWLPMLVIVCVFTVGVVFFLRRRAASQQH